MRRAHLQPESQRMAPAPPRGGRPTASTLPPARGGWRREKPAWGQIRVPPHLFRAQSKSSGCSWKRTGKEKSLPRTLVEPPTPHARAGTAPTRSLRAVLLGGRGLGGDPGDNDR